MVRGILKYSLIIAIALVVGYGGLAVYEEVTQTDAARVSASVRLAENQAENINRAMGDVSEFAGGSTGENASQTESQPETSDIGDIDALIARWEPLYEEAKLAYIKFEAAIESAKTSAAGYFATQQALTESISNPDARARAQEDDERDLALYRNWETQADSALAKAQAIGMQLDDMDAILRKLELRTDFVFDASSLQEIPSAISELNAELNEFRAASETIRAATASPFEGN